MELELLLSTSTYLLEQRGQAQPLGTASHPGQQSERQAWRVSYLLESSLLSTLHRTGPTR